MRKSNLLDFRFDVIGIALSSTQLVKLTVNLVHIIRHSIISPQIINCFQLASRGNETAENQWTEQTSYCIIAYMVKQSAKDNLRPVHRYLAIGKLAYKILQILFWRLIKEIVIRPSLTPDKLLCLFNHPLNLRHVA